MEIIKMLTISSCHVSLWGGAHFLEAEAACCKSFALTVYDKDEFGWFIYINQDELANSRNEIPEDLLRCIDLALENGCSMLCLDRDGEKLNALPQYEW